VPRNLITARLKSSVGNIAIDTDAGIIRGVKLMELGRLARFAGENGEAKQVKITVDHISALLAHAGNRAIPIHLTHDWFESQGKPNADTVEMNARIGALKGFRKDEAGDLIADAYLKEGATRADILWGAAHNPEDNCFSVVFSYSKDDPNCLPLNFRAGDIVPTGAATTALFSEDTTQTKPSMDITELLAALDDPAVKAAVKAILKSHTGPEDAAAEEAPAAAMESDAGVTDEDKKPEDDSKPALMRAQLRVARVINRKLGELKTERTALLAEAGIQAEAKATALLGKGGFTAIPADNGKVDAKAFITAQLANGCPNEATAIARMAKDKPELYAVFRG